MMVMKSFEDGADGVKMMLLMMKMLCHIYINHMMKESNDEDDDYNYSITMMMSIDDGKDNCK